MASRNLTEGAVDKVMVAFRCPRELKYKVLLRFGKKVSDECTTEAFIAACTAVTEDVKLTKEILDRIVEEQAEAYKERMRKRLDRDIRKGRVRPA